ncbi:uncharacterized protein BDV14DRAFT_197152 [Aspergillus stella-maris]|uniref:uncharacterized protein n=1 Tax=Aspergillus stella-maris TaxID=1810926 RepID=UPI003CCD779D
MKKETRSWYGLRHILRQKVKLAVIIYAPDPNEKAQSILLFWKIRRLVHVLMNTSGLRSIEIILRQHNGHEWQLNLEDLRHSVKTFSKYGCDMLFVPFHQLSRVNIRYPYETNHLFTNALKSADLNALLADINFVHGIELGTLPGRTAAMLRLEEFAERLRRSIGCSTFNFQTLNVLRKYPATIAAHDPTLEKLRVHYIAHDVLCFKSWYTIKSSDIRSPYKNNTWEQLLKVYPHGITESSETLVRELGTGIYTSLGDFSLSNLSRAPTRKEFLEHCRKILPPVLEEQIMFQATEANDECEARVERVVDLLSKMSRWWFGD